MSWEVLLIDLLFVMVILGGVWAIQTSLAATKNAKISGTNVLLLVGDWYGYFFGVLLIIIGISGIMGAFR